jgi:hypothetical protein
MEPSQEPSFLSQMMVGSSSSLPLFIVPHTAPPTPPKSKRDWKDDGTTLLLNLLEEKFLANSMNSLTQQQWQEIFLRIEEAFPLTPPRTWAQFQSKVHKMRKKFNQLKQKHGKSDAGQCKWPWFERCLMIWGKTDKACGTAGGMDNGVPIDSVGGSVCKSLSTWRTLKNMMLLLLQTDRFLHLQATLLKAVRLHPHRGQQAACKKPGVDGKPPQKIV